MEENQQKALLPDKPDIPGLVQHEISHGMESNKEETIKELKSIELNHNGERRDENSSVLENNTSSSLNSSTPDPITKEKKRKEKKEKKEKKKEKG